MKPFQLLYCVAVSAIVFYGCKSEKKSQDDLTAAGRNLEQGMKQLEESMKGTNENASGVVDFRVLKEALPDKLAGLPRTSHTGQKSSFGTIQVSTAQADYSEGDKRLDVTITDTGGFGMAMAGLAAWSSVDIDSESDTGYERTTMINGHKAFEKFNRNSNYGEVSMIYEKRFIVALNGTNIPMDDIRDAAEKIEIKL